MASTGLGTDACLAHGCLPLPVHYCSPVPDLGNLSNRRIWDRRGNLPGLQQEHLDEFQKAFPYYDPAKYQNSGGGFWIQRKQNDLLTEFRKVKLKK
ncbi:MAG: hypothetical protein ACM3X9_06680 [Bacillota bacterium]